jgi:pimeloyl-ACP methyl ester carboxylesterase
VHDTTTDVTPAPAPTATGGVGLDRTWLQGVAGGEVVATVGLRTHPAGGLRRALVEALALLLAHGAERVVLVAPAQAGDRPVLVVADVGPDGTRVVTAGPGRTPTATDLVEGWVVDLLRAAVDARDALLPVSPAQAAAQAARCVERGHVVVPGRRNPD